MRTPPPPHGVAASYVPLAGGVGGAKLRGLPHLLTEGYLYRRECIGSMWGRQPRRTQV